MIDLTLIVLGNTKNKNQEKNLEIIYNNDGNIIKDINDAQGKYIAFMKEDDSISEDYLKIILEKCSNDFDCCFINYTINYNYKRKMKIATDKYELTRFTPQYGDFIWSFIFKKEKLLKALECTTEIECIKKFPYLFEKTDAITKVIYFHNPMGHRYTSDLVFFDLKRNEYYKNVIYIGQGCNGCFNGYISWLKNIGRCFGDKYDLTLIYDEITNSSYTALVKYFDCVKKSNEVNYVCDRLSTTYSDYFFPKNMFVLEQSFMFIHGNMCDYENARKFYDDIYDHYVAVSKIAAIKAKGYFPTERIEYVLNPFKLDDELVRPHLRLTSAFRFSDIKRPERVEKMARLMDELNIPYTWNLFTDQKENTNVNGLVYRRRVTNPIPYVKDSDYFVLLSDSEAMPYCILEALAVNTKVVVTPLEAYDELGLNNENSIIIPFEYFETGNTAKLMEVIERMYKEKEKEVNYKIDESLWEGYNGIFIK